MKADEARHADNAEQAGARVLPPPIPALMAAGIQADEDRRLPL
jgi:ubiquinone biosynthesis monooxygenase Coq7